ncbi:hypothetical protein Zmor_006538 [Zophobas morio]|uniref:DUF4817 domain-containing protein n=1 Tax=Zophobas morio TaxID=2755281 RepID=A0AA38MNK4_9CUCU|nr:hypothetical protein Zmor_006538 [Zophobas morio]
MSISNEEYLEMMLIYGECNRNAAAAVREYTGRFPNRRHPHQHVFHRLLHRAREEGSFQPSRKGRAGAPRNVRVGAEEQVLENMEADPRRSVRCVAQMSGCSRSTTHRILQERRLHPYHYTRVQHLRPTDYPRRVHFAQWLLRQNELNPDFSRRILFTDECSFSQEGMFNTHNWHFWAHENPHLTRVRAYQERFTINL